MAGHVASAAEERCSDCVYEIGQSLTEMVDIWGENSGIGAVSGRVRSGDSTAELSNMPGMTGYTSPVLTDARAAAAPILWPTATDDRRYIILIHTYMYVCMCMHTYPADAATC